MLGLLGRSALGTRAAALDGEAAGDVQGCLAASPKRPGLVAVDVPVLTAEPDVASPSRGSTPSGYRADGMAAASSQGLDKGPS